MENSLMSKTIVLTGVTAGIGLAAAEQLVKRGAFLIGIGRSVEKCTLTQAHLQSLAPDAQAICLTADLSEQAAVRRVAQEIREVISRQRNGALDILINNAGTFRYWLTLTPEGFEVQWAVNHLAPFLLTHKLLPLLKAAPTARIVTVSSGSHYRTRLRWDDIQLRRRYNGLLAYKQTKLANVLFSAEFNRRMPPTVRAFAADPGLVDTNIGAKTDSAISRWIWKMRRKGGISAEESASGIVHLATTPDIQDASNLYWKHGVPKAPSPYALDEQNARRLWELSEKMCALTPGGFGA